MKSAAAATADGLVQAVEGRLTTTGELGREGAQALAVPVELVETGQETDRLDNQTYQNQHERDPGRRTGPVVHPE